LKRNQTADFNGFVALVTGARIKIGFEIAVKLLRDGATVIATTRFWKDAFLRYQKQPDYEKWA
jgi:NAD(P)-dependent dehydrogenase (short-subunit alcohol dehydrogenase family)